LKQSLLDVFLIPYLTEGSRSYDLLGYWRALEECNAVRGTPRDRAQWSAMIVADYRASLDDHPLEAVEEQQVLHSLALFFRDAGWLDGSISFGRDALERQDLLASKDDAGIPLTPEGCEKHIDLCLELGDSYLDKGDLP